MTSGRGGEVDTDIRPTTGRSEPLTSATVGSALAGVGAQAIVLISGILAARVLGPVDRGHLALLYLIPLILALLGGVGVPTAVPYFVARNPAAARLILRRVAPIALCQMVALPVLQLTILELAVLRRYPEIRPAALVSLASLPGMILYQYGIAILQGLRRLRLYNILRLVPGATYALALLLLLLVVPGDLELVTTIWALSLLLGGTLSFSLVLLLLPRLTTTEAPSRRQLLSFGARGLIGASSAVDDLQVDQILVGFLLDARTLGLYVTGLALTNLPRFIAESVSLTLYPHVAQCPTVRDGLDTLNRYLRIALPIVLATVLALLALVGTLIPVLFGASFAPAVPIARILLLASFAFALRRLLAEAARGLGRPGYGAIAEAVALVVLVPGVALLGHRGGGKGVAVAIAIAGACSVGIILALLRALARKNRAPVVPQSRIGRPTSVQDPA